jgi:hypothetical protein
MMPVVVIFIVSLIWLGSLWALMEMRMSYRIRQVEMRLQDWIQAELEPLPEQIDWDDFEDEIADALRNDPGSITRRIKSYFGY